MRCFHNANEFRARRIPRVVEHRGTTVTLDNLRNQWCNQKFPNRGERERGGICPLGYVTVKDLCSCVFPYVVDQNQPLSSRNPQHRSSFRSSYARRLFSLRKTKKEKFALRYYFFERVVFVYRNDPRNWGVLQLGTERRDIVRKAAQWYR
ncbi:uncharacterized protein LOC143150623 [Ptiloglossa arizonensis]|uniref:uncharacterized protein LOC143150623 n=1 Tax=Ptiloglossa arizonensis TaxID=3350558 RepID=UPI003F9FC806